VTKAYRTTSIEVPQVIAGVIPIDLLIEVRTRIYTKERGQDDACSVKAIVKHAIGKWQERWHTTPKGRTTFAFFDNIKDRLKNRWVRPDHYMTQFLSGHLDFNSKLKTFGLSAVDTCDCGEEDTPHHILEDWPIYNEDRQKLRNAIQKLGLDRPEEKWEFVTKNVYRHFRQFTRSVLREKEEKRRRILRETGASSQQGRLPERRSTQPDEQSSQHLRRSPRLARRAPEQNEEQRWRQKCRKQGIYHHTGLKTGQIMNQPRNKKQRTEAKKRTMDNRDNREQG
jgi:hypothetical protein